MLQRPGVTAAQMLSRWPLCGLPFDGEALELARETLDHRVEPPQSAHRRYVVFRAADIPMISVRRLPHCPHRSVGVFTGTFR